MVKQEDKVIEIHKDAEVPYELVQKFDMNGNARLYTRNIRDVKGDIEQKENVAKIKVKEAEEAEKTVVAAKKRAAKSIKKVE